MFCQVQASETSPANRSSNNTVRLVTFPIPLMVEDANCGLFIDLVRAIESESNLSFEIEVLPTPRALRYFKELKYDVLFPGLDTLFDDQWQIHPSRELLYIKQDFVFTMRDRPLITDAKALEGLTLGLTRSYPYAREITDNPHINKIFVTTDELNAQMLAGRRIDAFLVEESSGLQAFKKTGLLDKVHYNSGTPVSTQDVYFTFQNSMRGNGLEKEFSTALLKMKETGEFDRILSGAKSTGLKKAPSTESKN